MCVPFLCNLQLAPLRTDGNYSSTLDIVRAQYWLVVMDRTQNFHL